MFLVCWFTVFTPAPCFHFAHAEPGISLSEDGGTIWFASSRGGSFDIYTATR